MIPQIDKEIGISVYTTKSSSISGKIKQNENDFSVKEVLSEKAIDSFDNLEGHAVYLLKKSGIDTNHALIDIEKRYIESGGTDAMGNPIYVYYNDYYDFTKKELLTYYAYVFIKYFIHWNVVIYLIEKYL